MMRESDLLTTLPDALDRAGGARHDIRGISIRRTADGLHDVSSDELRKTAHGVTLADLLAGMQRCHLDDPYWHPVRYATTAPEAAIAALLGEREERAA